MNYFRMISFLAKKLDEECGSDEECRTAFSICKNGKCRCSTGFEAADQMCKPIDYSCPYGDPLKDGGSVKQCERTYGTSFQTPIAMGNGSLNLPKNLSDAKYPQLCITVFSPKADDICFVRIYWIFAYILH